METEGEFRVIDPETGKPRAAGTESWSEETYRAWKRLPLWKRYGLIIPIPAVAIALALGAAFVQWAAHR